MGNNRLSKLADVVVQTSRPKEITNRSAATNSLLAQFATIDIIFYLYMAKNEKLTEKVTQTKEVIKNYVKQNEITDDSFPQCHICFHCFTVKENFIFKNNHIFKSFLESICVTLLVCETN